MTESEAGFNQMDDIVNALTAGSQQLKTMFSQLQMEYDAVRDSTINQIRIQAEVEKREQIMTQLHADTNIAKVIVVITLELLKLRS
ncbi:hypothetical protein MXB_2221 [Myxobolus squamalis]|nr:hypothetical protein MXB_2221 [Myxobolus squamalis]